MYIGGIRYLNGNNTYTFVESRIVYVHCFRPNSLFFIQIIFLSPKNSFIWISFGNHNSSTSNTCQQQSILFGKIDKSVMSVICNATNVEM